MVSLPSASSLSKKVGRRLAISGPFELPYLPDRLTTATPISHPEMNAGGLVFVNNLHRLSRRLAPSAGRHPSSSASSWLHVGIPPLLRRREGRITNSALSQTGPARASCQAFVEQRKAVCFFLCGPLFESGVYLNILSLAPHDEV